jgi:hypothetical protein
MFRNRIINGDMRINQRNAGAAQTITAGAALAYTVDRWYAYCTGANVTGQRVAGSGTTRNRYQFTGAASVTAIGFAQRIESDTATGISGGTATLSVDLSNSLLTTVTWTAFYANTSDTFGTLASPTRTSIASGTFTVSNTLTKYSAQISIPSAATTGIEIVLSVGAQTSGTWVIGNVQLEPGSSATPFEVRPIGTELALCQRYYWRWAANVSELSLTYSSFAGAGNNSAVSTIYTPVSMRAVPTISHNLANANFVTVAPTGIQWGVLTAGISFTSKTGTAIFSILPTNFNSVTLRILSPDFASAPNSFVCGPSVAIEIQAEL